MRFAVWIRRSAAALVLVAALAQVACSPRQIQDLASGWTFNKGDVPGAQTPGFNDSGWEQVSLPHTWNAIDGETYNQMYRGIGWYRRHLQVSGSLAGQQSFLTFDGANLKASVYLNGQSVGGHAGGFAAFTLDVTAAILPGQDNVIAVKVDNSFDPNIAPLSGDFSMFGGLYRDVRLTSTPKVHISLTDYSSPGVYLTQTNVSAASANIAARVMVQNDGTAAANVTTQVDIIDSGGNILLTSNTSQMIAGGGSAQPTLSFVMANPHLWNGRADPFLYGVHAQVLIAGGQQDEVWQTLGLRFYKIDPSLGFFLNGQYLDLHGAAFHQDRLDKGWAISDADSTQDVGFLQEIGATFVRLAHYQHSQTVYNLLDQYGIVAWSEVPFVSWSNLGYSTGTPFMDNLNDQLREMVRQNYNHPSIVVWGMYNELGDDPNTEALVQQEVALAHAEDQTRPTTAAAAQGRESVAIAFIPDVIAVNHYSGWYSPNYNDVAGFADAYHAAHPTRAFGFSEFGAGASITEHQDNPPMPVWQSTWHPEEYQNLLHEAYWSQLSTRPYIWCKSIWNLFDFASEYRNEGDTPGRNDKGLITYDRQTRKDAFYFYKANWTPAPLVYLTDRRFTVRTSDQTTIKVYSNMLKVEVQLNGTSLGSQQSPNHVFTWPNVTLASGSNAVVAIGSDGMGGTQTDTVNWTAP